MSLSQDTVLGNAPSDDSDLDEGYDSEAQEVSRTSRAKNARSNKRRKLSHSSSEAEGFSTAVKNVTESEVVSELDDEEEEDDEATQQSLGVGARQVGSVKNQTAVQRQHGDNQEERVIAGERKRTKKRKKESRPGVIYLSSVPPHLRPSALRNLVEQRGFSPITRLFLTPINKADATSNKTAVSSKARRSYSEGWVEIASHKAAKLCAQTLNATPIGGKKGGYYRDDLWNMKYLRGMGWDELMEGVRGEKREEEARRDEERRQIQLEAKLFLEGVEEGKRVEGIREKRKQKGQKAVSSEPKRIFRQFETRQGESKVEETISNDTREVLGKIF